MYAKTLFVIDLDRCLITEAIYELYNTTITDHIKNIDNNAKNAARASVEASGGSFDLSAWLLQQQGVSEKRFRHLTDDFIARAHAIGQDQFLAPGACDLLDALERSGIPHLIMTYGGKQNQIAKLRATKLDIIPYMIVDDKHKAYYIQAWQNEQAKAYEVPVGKKIITATTIVLVDDKAGAFDRLPLGSARGYWVKAEHLLASQKGVVPVNVTPVSSLDEIVSLEQLG